MRLILRDANDNDLINEVLPGPGGTVRFAVGTEDCHSGVFRVWANRSTNDVYVAVRSIINHQKWSLHQSNDWRYQWVNPAKAREFTDSDERLIDQWSPPQEIGGIGWTVAFMIHVRHEDVVGVSTNDVVPELMLLPPPGPRHTAIIRIVIARPNAMSNFIETKNLLPFTGFTLADGRAVLFTLSHVPTPAETANEVDNIIAQAVAAAPLGTSFDQPNIRLMTYGNAPDGTRTVWDIAVSQRTD